MAARRFAALVPAAAILLYFAACGGDDDSPTSVTPPPDVSGTYYARWTLQVLRKSDGFQKAFYCSGQLTLTQGTTAGATATLSGFAVAGSPCAPESYDLQGTIVTGGAVEFTTNAPRPTEGTCPGGKNVRFSGEITAQDGWRQVSVRGVTTVSCPSFGDHEFTYLIEGSR
jgi:hypothetical protein